MTPNCNNHEDHQRRFEEVEAQNTKMADRLHALELEHVKSQSDILHILKSIDDIKTLLETIAKRPAVRLELMINTAITALVTAGIMYLITQFLNKGP